ncbi:hypothetical protein N8I77_005736 [Diaporthe amygdali]|uniref:Peptidase A1 domain-containing protein n=1 Tax=Phomopsis amygdali TaxID=1214568 RepID=A0AAD9W516_PHOAM|nr:hypothetical protein N8I77_005736 [Diaporthe amygdali]
MLDILLITGFIALAVVADRPPLPAWGPRPLTLEHRGPIQTALPDASSRHDHPIPQSRSKRGAKDRFRKTENYAHLHRYSGRPFGKYSASNGLGLPHNSNRLDGSQNITDLNSGFWYGVNVTLGTQELTLVLDTGSSDTWVFSNNTNCIGITGPDGEPIGDRMCTFGPRFQGDFPQGPYEHEHFSTDYWRNQTVNGSLGQMDVTVGGVHVTNQTVGLADSATWWLGSGRSSGVLGLAYPGLTKAFFDPDGPGNLSYQSTYSPVFSTMIAQGLTEGFFSLALNRPGSSETAGVIAFGGVPDDLEGIEWGRNARTDIIIANVDGVDSSASEYSFYTIIADGWYFDGATDERRFAYIVDSDTPLNILPTDIVDEIAEAFDPPAEYSDMFGFYVVDCDAIIPEVAVVINGTSFYLNSADLVLDAAKGINDPCFIAFNDGGPDGPYVLGSVFLKNVLAVFDIENAVMEFAGREFY